MHHDVEAPIDSDNHGVLFLNSRLSHDDIADGTRYTLFIGEKVVEEADDLGWMSGTRATLRNTGTPINRTGPQAMAPQPVPAAVTEDLEASQSAAINDDAAVSSPGESDATTSDPNAPIEPPIEVAVPPAVAPSAEQVQALRRQGLYVGGFGSSHLAGAMFAFGDGHVMFLPDSTDPRVYRQLGHRADGQLLDAQLIDR